MDEARANFRQLLCDSSTKVETMRVKLGLCVEKAKPYYEARFTANEALRQTQIAAMRLTFLYLININYLLKLILGMKGQTRHIVQQEKWCT